MTGPITHDWLEFGLWSTFDDVVTNDAFLPSQIDSSTNQLSPETHLAWRVLMQGMVDCLVVSRRYNGVVTTKEARAWVLSDKVYPFSFVDLCQSFNINHQQLRQLLRRASRQPELLQQIIKFTGMKRIIASSPRHKVCPR